MGGRGCAAAQVLGDRRRKKVFEELALGAQDIAQHLVAELLVLWALVEMAIGPLYDLLSEFDLVLDPVDLLDHAVDDL